MLKQKKCRKRNKNGKNKIISKSVKFYGINAAGIKSKLKSFDNIISVLKPSIWAIQETKLKPGETIKCESENEYQIFYLNRQKLQGGGIALGVDKRIETTLIRDGNEVEILSVQAQLGGIPTRIVVGYRPQESDKIEEKERFLNFMEQEVNEADLLNHGLMIQMDGNLHAGDLVKNDPNIQNKNGKMFSEFLGRNKSLVVLNCQDACKGLITRKRVFEERTDEGV